MLSSIKKTLVINHSFHTHKFWKERGGNLNPIIYQREMTA